ncbi:hypothetical protein M2281_000906 [Mesorhizobium soli]|uniref:hypothetical protein n=1 Tax=Pseudaminobacter soli (ex Li et al. 2025) TaxID=1295366 RepID=UPI0024730EDC|nr:hypothetical protein [Mesorhizobium soli]MDH6230334.1 hypothetical protein [Mesorhizobium soli]
MPQSENRDDRKRSLLAYARDEQGRDAAQRSGSLLAMAKARGDMRGDPTPPRQPNLDPREDDAWDIAASPTPEPKPAPKRLSVFGRIAGRFSSLLPRRRKKPLAGTTSQSGPLPGTAEMPAAIASGTALDKVAVQLRRAPEFNDRDKNRLLSGVRSLFGRDGADIDRPVRQRAFAASHPAKMERGDNTFVVVINEGQRDTTDDRRGRRARKRRKPLFGDGPDAEWNRAPAVTGSSEQPRTAAHIERWQVPADTPSVSANLSRAPAPTAPAPIASQTPAAAPHDPVEDPVASSIEEIRTSLQDFRQAVEELTRSRTRRRYF